MASLRRAYSYGESDNWDSWNYLPEESEEIRGEYKLGSDDSDEISNRSEKDEIDGVPNRENLNEIGETSSDTGLKLPNLQKNRIKHSHSVPGSRTNSRTSAYQQSSGSSIELDSPGFNSETSRSPIPRLKPNSTSPAALNTISGTEGDVSDPNSPSPRLTPTHSNFGDSQLIGPSMGISYHPHTHTLQIQNDSMNKSPRSSSLSRQGSNRKKKRSGSWYNVLSPSYKQKNEDFHKFFKDLPLAERLLVDYNCALMKDIIIQGRLYVSQNYLCFHSNILKWQTAVVVKLVDIDQMTKEKTVKVIPNAIQCLMKDKTKMTFTSFTARDRAYLTTFRLWQNALLDKPMSASELWSQIHRNYGEELGLCSSDDDYVRPEYIPRKHQPLGDAEGDIGYEFGTTNKVKRKKKSSNSTQTNDDEFDKVHKNESKSNKSSSQDSCNQSTGDEKSMRSSQGSFDDVSLGDDLQDEDEMEESEHLIDHEEEEDGRVIRKSADETKESRKSSKSLEAGDKEIESDDEPSDLALSDCAKISLCRRYETSARDLFRIIFGDCSECTFWKDTLVNKGTTDIEFTTWADDSQVKGQRVRDLSYTLRLDNPIGPKTSHCKEAQILYPSTVIGKSYGVDCIVQNYGIPYADYFQTCMRYCIRKVTRNVCELRISSELRYKKTPWGLIKNFIEKNVASGLNQNFKKLECQLQEQIDLEKTQSQPMVNGQQKTSSNVRRRKRGSESASRESPTHKNRNTPSSRSTSSSSRRRGRSKGNRSDMNNNKGGSTPSEATSPGIPSPLTPNGFIPNSIHKHGVDSPKMLYFGNGAKFIIGAIFFIFILLVYSNYSMYQRLTTLEQVATAAAAADGVNPSVTAALLDRPGVSITDNPEILSTYLQAIDKRLHKLEEMMVTFVETSENKWNNMESEWTTMKNLIRTILQQKATSGGQ